MSRKIVVVLAVAALVTAFHLSSKLVERGGVRSAIAEILSPANAHTFTDRAGVEAALRAAAERVAGEDAGVLVEVYHFRGMVYREEVGDLRLPPLGGVEVVGEQIRVSVLAARVSWYQEILGTWERDVSVTKTVFVAPERVGYHYGPPPAGTFDFMDAPWLLLDPSR